jgi:uncharacterized protein YukE
VANIGSDVVGFITGPPGDPGRIRQAAKHVEDLSARYDADRRAINEAVDELLRIWHGDSATDFAAKWYRGGAGGPAATAVLADAKQRLDGFAKKLNDYADQLEHAQHDHWIQTALMAGLTVVNVVQLGLDPATDAAEVGLASVGTMALRQGAIAGFSDLVGQAGADLWDHLDSGFDGTGDHVVGWFDPLELIVTTAEGAIGGAMMAGTAQLVGRVVQRLATHGAAVAGDDWVLSIDKLASASDAPDRNGFTAAGRALQKHSNRPGSAFSTPCNSPVACNPAGEKIVREILDTPGTTIETRSRPRYGNFIDIVAPDGRGMRYRVDGSFVGLLEPHT